MSDQPTSDRKPAACDGKDHGVSPDRLGQLKADADIFNHALQDSQHAHNEPQAFAASKAFYEQLTQLPIGERRALAAFAQEQNKSMSARDEDMPLLEIAMDSRAFVNDVTVKYPLLRARDIRTNEMGWIREYFTFKYRGMCAEFGPSTTELQVDGKNSANFEIGTLGSPFFRHK